MLPRSRSKVVSSLPFVGVNSQDKGSMYWPLTEQLEDVSNQRPPGRRASWHLEDWQSVMTLYFGQRLAGDRSAAQTCRADRKVAKRAEMQSGGRCRSTRCCPPAPDYRAGNQQGASRGTSIPRASFGAIGIVTATRTQPAPISFLNLATR